MFEFLQTKMSATYLFSAGDSFLPSAYLQSLQRVTASGKALLSLSLFATKVAPQFSAKAAAISASINLTAYYLRSSLRHNAGKIQTPLHHQQHFCKARCADTVSKCGRVFLQQRPTAHAPPGPRRRRESPLYRRRYSKLPCLHKNHFSADTLYTVYHKR